MPASHARITIQAKKPSWCGGKIEYWHAVDPIITDFERCHQVTCPSIATVSARHPRAGGLLRKLLVWKLRQVLKISVGYWDSQFCSRRA